jgi:hypothetical protein
MADLNVQRESDERDEDDPTAGELAFWIIGILMIPLVPILMVAFLTPHSGM